MGVALLGLALAQAAAADSRPPPTHNPQAIIVTGERVKRSLKDTPSSVAVFRRSEIEQMGAPDRLQQVLEFVPNVRMGSSRDTPSIRGQDSIGVLQALPGFLGGARPRTTVQVDGRAVGYNEFAFGIFGLWDIGDIEVFRSPQTTTQGPNAIAGAIFINTADPTYVAEAQLRAIGGEARTRQLSGVVSVPLVDDQLALRISGDLRRSHTSSVLSGPVEGVNLNHDRYGTVRAKLLAEPRSLPGLRALLTFSHSQSAAPQVETAVPPFRERRDPMVLYGYFKIKEDSVAAAVTYPVSDALQSRTTLTWGDGRIRRFAPGGFGESRIHGRDHSLESILEWKPAGPVSMIGGVHLLAQDLNQRIDLTATPLGIGAFTDHQRGRGLFGEITWRPAPAITVTGGLRYQSDSKARAGGLSGGLLIIPVDFDHEWHALLPKLSVAYDVTPDLRVGVMALRAYNPGGVSVDLQTEQALRFDAEHLWDYEAFTRASFMGGALTLDGNLFYNDIRNAQRQLDISLDSPLGPVGLSAISNAPRAHTYGAELDAVFNASDHVTLRASAGFLGTRLTETVLPKDPILGKQFFGSPAFTGAAGIEWKPGRDLQLSSQVRHSSGYFGDDANSPILRVHGATTVDARASWSRRPFTLFVYAQNLFDALHVLYWAGPEDNPRASAVLNDPREIGLGIESRF